MFRNKNCRISSPLDQWLLLWPGVNYKPSHWSVSQPQQTKSRLPSDSFGFWFIQPCKWRFLFLPRSLWHSSHHLPEMKRKILKSYWPRSSDSFRVSPGILGGVLKYDRKRGWKCLVQVRFGDFLTFYDTQTPQPLYMILYTIGNFTECVLGRSFWWSNVGWCLTV